MGRKVQGEDHVTTMARAKEREKENESEKEEKREQDGRPAFNGHGGCTRELRNRNSLHGTATSPQKLFAVRVVKGAPKSNRN
jgi:hypothetical protein